MNRVRHVRLLARARCIGSGLARGILLLAILLLITCNDIESPDGNGGFDTTVTDTTGGGDSTQIQDTTPPVRIADAAFILDENTLIPTLTWTAPSDDSASEAVQEYRIRFAISYSLVDYWDIAYPLPHPPLPEAPGSRQSSAGFFNIERGRNLYAAIKSMDEAGNLSARSNIATVHIPGFLVRGRCTDAGTGYPVGGLAVTIMAGRVFRLETTVDGTFEQADLTRDIQIDITTGMAAQPYHELLQPIHLLGDSTQAVCMIPFETTQTGDFPSLLMLFKIMTRTTANDLSTILRTWKTRPVPLYIPPFVNEYDIDYGTLARQAAERWMQASGWELFRFVDARPDTGIAFEFRTAEEMGALRGITEHDDGADLYPIFDTIALADYLTDADFIYRVCLHELGHTIRFGHLSSPHYIMYGGQPLPGDISTDELEVLRLLRALPNGLDMAVYNDQPPAAQ